MGESQLGGALGDLVFDVGIKGFKAGAACGHFNHVGAALSN